MSVEVASACGLVGTRLLGAEQSGHSGSPGGGETKPCGGLGLPMDSGLGLAMAFERLSLHRLWVERPTVLSACTWACQGVPLHAIAALECRSSTHGQGRWASVAQIAVQGWASHLQSISHGHLHSPRLMGCSHLEPSALCPCGAACNADCFIH